MKLCIPVEINEALNSIVYGHFGSAPLFLIVDSEALTVEPLTNHDEHHVHGACNPLKALAGRTVDAVIVGGIGAGAVRGLRQSGIVVDRSSTQAGGLPAVGSATGDEGSPSHSDSDNQPTR